VVDSTPHGSVCLRGVVTQAEALSPRMPQTSSEVIYHSCTCGANRNRGSLGSQLCAQRPTAPLAASSYRQGYSHHACLRLAARLSASALLYALVQTGLCVRPGPYGQHHVPFSPWSTHDSRLRPPSRIVYTGPSGSPVTTNRGTLTAPINRDYLNPLCGSVGARHAVPRTTSTKIMRSALGLIAYLGD
jgi:hypothetical protein